MPSAIGRVYGEHWVTCAKSLEAYTDGGEGGAAGFVEAGALVADQVLFVVG